MKRRSIGYWFGVLALTIVVAHQLSIHRTQALTFTVTTEADNGNNGSPTAGSLRKAILDANANSGLDTIQFNIPVGGVHEIDPPATLPIITSPVIIDGYTQPGSSVNTGTTTFNATINIRLNGLLSNVNGLFLGAGSSGSTIKGLQIIQFSGHGIRVDSSSNKVQGRTIGASFAAGGNGSDGVLINNTNNNIIGTDGDGANDLAEKNVISGNDANGVEIFGPNASGNSVKGNFIGTDGSGTGGLGNTLDGVEIEQAINNTIGGTTANERNIISGNGSDGVEIRKRGNWRSHVLPRRRQASWSASLSDKELRSSSTRRFIRLHGRTARAQYLLCGFVEWRA